MRFLYREGKYKVPDLSKIESFPEGEKQVRQTTLSFSVEGKNRCWMSFDRWISYDEGDAFYFEIIDTATDKVVSKYKLFGSSVFKIDKPKDFSSRHKIKSVIWQRSPARSKRDYRFEIIEFPIKT